MSDQPANSSDRQKYPADGLWDANVDGRGFVHDLKHCINECDPYIESDFIHDKFPKRANDWSHGFFNPEVQIRRRLEEVRQKCLTEGKASGEDWSISFLGSLDDE